MPPLEFAPLADLERELAHADVVLACTGAGDTVITADVVERARAKATAPLLIVDIALPRDVEAATAHVSGVTLRDLHDLRDWAARGMEKRASEASKVRDIVSEEVERFQIESMARQAAPLIAQLRESDRTDSPNGSATLLESPRRSHGRDSAKLLNRSPVESSRNFCTHQQCS